MRSRLATALLVALAWGPAPAGADSLALVGGTVVDGTGAPARPGQTVLVAGDRILRVGPAEAVPVPDGAEVIDAAGKWIIPGLIDAHVHFFQSGGLYTRPDVMDLRHRRPYSEEIAAIRRDLDATLARYIASGVTGVVDMGGPMWTFELRERAAALEVAPRVAVAGPLLGTIAPDALSGLDDPPIIAIDGPEQAREQVRRLLRRDPDLIKVWFVPDGSLDADMPWVRAAIAAADAAGVPVVAHATRLDIARAVVAAGVDVLAHSVEDAAFDAGFAQTLARRDVVYVTTLVVDEGYREVLGGAVDLSPIERRLGDPRAIASWRDLPGPRRLAGPAVSEAEARNLRRAAEHGVTIAAGSDAGNIGTLHGPALHRELRLMVAHGLTPLQALTAATRGGAAAMGRAADLGTIEPGKLADLVVLDRDPLADIANAAAIDRVVKGGVVVHD